MFVETSEGLGIVNTLAEMINDPESGVYKLLKIQFKLADKRKDKATKQERARTGTHGARPL